MKVSSDPPLSTVMTATQAHDGATNRFLNLNRMKKFGGKIKQFFRGKTSTGVVEGAIGVTTTAVTTVEYTSKHPITLPKDKGKRKAIEKKQSNLSSARRQSMPMSAVGPALTVSSPRPLRPSSFLLLEDPSERTASRRLSMKSSTSAGRLRDEHTLGPDANPSESKEATSNYANLPAVTASPTTPRTRPRTQTAPHKSTHGGAVKPRRMSLSSAISRSRLDMLRTAIIPHPPLPQHVTDTIREDLRARAATFSPEPIFDNGTMLNGGYAMGTEMFEPESEALKILDEQAQNAPVVEHPEPDERVIRANELLVRNHPTYGDHEDEELCEPVFVKDDKVPQTPRRSTKAVASGMRRTPQSPGETPSQSKGRRARGFSLSSAISSRAMKAKSLILGRQTLQEPGPRLPPSLVGTPARQDEHIFSPTSSVGCADYEPNLALDNISFAHMSAFTSSAVSTEDMLSREISPSEQDVHRITLNGLPVDTDDVGMDVDEGGGKAEDEREEQQRSLVCALGLPYEDQTQTTSDSS
ncbi:hypothetical protein EIP86_002928 [Pleurotus ostreatoroseus]|nr:hypothetical protein EIP86_002928 [Pleurotus ostreatoroseus]